MKKRVLSLLLSFVMLFSLLPAAAFADGAEELPAQPLEEISPEPLPEELPPEAEEVDLPETVEPEPSAALDGPEEEPAAVPGVRVSFACTPAETAVTVYDPARLDGSGEPAAIAPEDNGSYLLLSGDYCYDAACEGYARLEKQPFTVADEALTLCVALLPMPASETTPELIGEPLLESLPSRAAEVVKSGACGESGSSLRWTYYDDGLLEITGTGAIKNCGYGGAQQPWAEYRASVTALSLPEGLTGIGENAFQGLSALQTVTIPAQVSSIGSSAFSSCSSLTGVTIPASVTALGSGAFAYCASLQSIQVASGNAAFRSDGGVLYSADGATLLAFPAGREGVFNVPSGVTAIGPSAFSGCKKLTDLTLPAGLTAIGESAFSSCSKLTALTLPDGLTTIGKSAFSECQVLSHLSIPASVTSIGESAFYLCRALSVVGPAGTECDIELGWTESIPGGAFKGARSIVRVVLPEGIKTIGTQAFNTCASLVEITLPGSLKTLYESAFASCGRLATVHYGATETCRRFALDTLRWKSSGNDALWNASWDYTDTPGVIGSGDCGATLADQVGWKLYGNGKLSITGSGRMANYSSSPWINDVAYITNVEIGDGVTSIGNYAFRNISANNSKISSVSIGRDVTEIGSHAFDGCNVLSSLALPDGLLSIGSSAFYGCSSLKTVTVGSALQSVGSYAFYNCGALESIVLPAPVTEIGTYAFCNCTKLKTVTVPAALKTVGENAFKNCGALTDVYYGANSTGRTAQEGKGWKTNGNDTFFGASWHYTSGPSGWDFCGPSAYWQYNRVSKTLTIKGSGETPRKSQM